MKKILAGILISIMLFTIIGYASETRDLELFSKNELDNTLLNVVNSMVHSDATYINNNQDLFTIDAYYDIIDCISKEVVQDGNIGSVSIEFTYPENSSTGDSVVMLNTKIRKHETQNQLVYMFEFHINSEGKIYGFNIWAY